MYSTDVFVSERRKPTGLVVSARVTGSSSEGNMCSASTQHSTPCSKLPSTLNVSNLVSAPYRSGILPTSLLPRGLVSLCAPSQEGEEKEAVHAPKKVGIRSALTT